MNNEIKGLSFEGKPLHILMPDQFSAMYKTTTWVKLRPTEFNPKKFRELAY
jgi:hypothetical protein